MEFDTSGWSGEGEFTKGLIDALRAIESVDAVKVEDAPASRADAGFSFISNEVFVRFETAERIVRRRQFGFIPRSLKVHEKVMTLQQLETTLAAHPAVGLADYSDEGMLQFLRTERVVAPYQTRGYKVIELVRVYEAGSMPRRDP